MRAAHPYKYIAIGQAALRLRETAIAIGAVCAMLIGLSAVASASNMPTIWAGQIWSGHYSYQDGRPPVPFTMTIKSQQGGRFTAVTSEPNTFDKEGCSYSTLTAGVSGTIEGNNLQFRKTYDGQCGHRQSVLYTGAAGFQPTGPQMNGSWRLESISGSFDAGCINSGPPPGPGNNTLQGGSGIGIPGRAP